jgi:hypothetical protein
VSLKVVVQMSVYDFAHKMRDALISLEAHN